MPFDNLCPFCRTVIWGKQGWETFNVKTPGLSYGRLAARERRSCPFSRSPKELAEQTTKCQWCRLVYAHLRPSSSSVDEAAQAESDEREILFIVQLGSNDQVRDAKILNIQVSCPGKSTEFRLAVIAKQGSLASKTVIEHREFCEPSFDNRLVAEWLSESLAEGYVPQMPRFEDLSINDLHQDCVGFVDKPLPTRVIDLREMQISSRVYLREIDPTERDRYVCLSYTWGRIPDLPKRYVELAEAASTSEGLDCGRLPATIFDAALVALLLKIRYLWVDGLCIRQNDLADKLRELPKMNQYYTNAMFVIQASGTTSVNESFLGKSPEIMELFTNFLREGPKAAVQFIELPFIDKHGQEDSIFACSSEDKWWFQEHKEVAATRGWILQEQILAPRLLIFPSQGGMIFRSNAGRDGQKDVDDGLVLYSPHQVRPARIPKAASADPSLGHYFASGTLPLDESTQLHIERVRAMWDRGIRPCSLVMDSDRPSYQLNFAEKDGEPVIEPPEDGYVLLPVPDETDPSIASRQFAEFVSRDVHTIVGTILPQSRIDNQQLHKTWKETVNDYCQRDLSNADDVLAAIAAVAREFHQRHEQQLGKFFCGLWLNHLAEGLMWKVHPDDRQKKPLNMANKIPSWSWAAVKRATYKPSWGEGDVFGHKVQRAAQYVCLKVLESTVTPQSPDLEFESVVDSVLEVEGQVLEAHWFQRFSLDVFRDVVSLDLGVDDPFRTHRYEALPDCVEHEPTDREAVTLLMVTTGETVITMELEGLVLKPTARESVYNRVGTFRMRLALTPQELPKFKERLVESTSKLSII